MATAAADITRGHRGPWWTHLYVQVLTAIAIGVLFGHFYPQTGEAMKPLGEAFIKAIKMIIAPIIFLTVVHGVASMDDMKKVGRVGFKALIYFEIVTTLALIVGLIVVNLWKPGAGMSVNVSGLDTSGIAAFTTKAKDQSTIAFLMNIIPDTVVGAFANGEILQVLFFAFGLQMLGARGKAVLHFIEAIRIGVWAASGALNSIRIAKGKAAETKTRKKATYRGRHILLKRPSNLTAKQAFALDGMLANDADLREAYEAKERFFQIWDAPDRGSAEMAIDEWMETVPPQHRAAFKHAITALEDWREEVLTYWGEFPEISNAYTEAANGMAKIHNRKGRGYKFEVIRARVLIDMRTVTPTDFVKCHGCGIGFAAGRLVAQEAVSIGRGRRKVHLTLCPNCMVRNQSGMMKLKHQPTLQSE